MKRAHYIGPCWLSAIPLCLAVGALTAGVATAQTTPLGTGLDIEQYEPIPAIGANILNVSTTRFPESFRPSASIHLNYADGSLTSARVVEDEENTVRLVDERVSGELAVSMAFFDIVSVGIAFPATLSQSGEDFSVIGRSGSINSSAMGDIRIVPKIRFWYPAATGGFGLHFFVPIHVPTGSADDYTSDEKVRVQPMLGLDYRDRDGLHLAVNAGVQFRPERTTADFVGGSQARWSAGVEVPTNFEPLSIVATVYGSVQLAPNRNPEDLTQTGGVRHHTAEITAGFRVRALDAFSATIAGGAAFSGHVGAPKFRFVTAIGYTPFGSARDRDDDGVIDLVDGCPNAAEDLDGFEDDDGCPETDNDEDGIRDGLDDCPLKAEDPDGFQDSDGCPDDDNDDDGLVDSEDLCPNTPEDRDGFKDDDGCPDTDNDNDGFADLRDRCPDEPEDVDGFQDGDGCIDPDNDDDGILDANDRCPNLPEAFNGIDDEDGCPDSQSGEVRVGEAQIFILRRVHFTKNGTRLERRSFPLLNAVADVILANAQITLLRIDGHTDDLGSDRRNMIVSQARADAVLAYLIQRGVDPAILSAKGWGATQPVADDTSQVGRAQNRRVEFRILELNGLSARASNPEK